VLTAQRGGTFRESYAIAKSYAEARQQHGQSQLLDEIVAAKPEIDRKRYHSPDELKQQGLARLRQAVELLGPKATPDEVEAYKHFVMSLTDRVANAHREDGVAVSDAERAAMDDVASAIA
jgi:hypothetical protein